MKETQMPEQHQFRFEGDLSVVKEIEKLIRDNAMCFERKPKTYDNLFGVESAVKTLVLDIYVPKRDYMFPVRFVLDSRTYSKSVIDVNNKHVELLFTIIPGINTLLGKLETVTSKHNREDRILNEMREESAKETKKEDLKVDNKLA